METRSGRVDKVAVANKHPGVFVETVELEAETGESLPQGITEEEVTVPPLRRARPSSQKTETVTSSVSQVVPESKADSAEPMETEQESKETPEEKASTTSTVAVAIEEEVSLKEEVTEPEEAKVIEPEATTEQPVEEDDVKVEESPQVQEDSEVPDKHEDATEKNEKESDNDKDADVSVSTVSTRRRTKLKNELENPPVPKSEAGSEEDDSERDNESIDSSSTLTTRSSAKRRAAGVEPHAHTLSKSKSKKSKSTLSTKGKGRRIIFKKSATKAPLAVAQTVTSERIFFKGQYYTRGDIVSCIDIDGGVFYAQLRGFMTDQYCEKSGVITWLLPTTQSPPPEEGFDPATYVIGPEEELPRKLDFFTFVMHAPDDYFYYKNAPYPTRSHSSDQEYVLTRAGPKVRLIKNGKSYYRDTA